MGTKAANRRYYLKTKKDPARYARHKEKSREGMRRMRARRAWKTVPRTPAKNPLTEELTAYRVTSLKNLDHPNLSWLDKHGRLHIEEELSAEELIRQWKEKYKP